MQDGTHGEQERDFVDSFFERPAPTNRPRADLVGEVNEFAGDEGWALWLSDDEGDLDYYGTLYLVSQDIVAFPEDRLAGDFVLGEAVRGVGLHLRALRLMAIWGPAQLTTLLARATGHQRIILSGFGISAPKP